jgi:pimeloyl-ACP methyl ester carboxylesterase
MLPGPSSDQDLHSELARLLGRARRHHSPCGDGQIVWHEWSAPVPAALPLVLLHGGSGSWTHWLRNLDALVASGRRVLVPDLPGFGDSALPPDGRDADAMPVVLEQGLQQLMGQAPCELVGFSFGAMVAALLSQEQAHRVARLVLIAPPGLGRPTLESIAPRAWRHLQAPAQRLAMHTHNLREIMLHHEASITPLACQLQQLNAERDRLPHRRLSRTDRAAQALRQVHCPVHVLYGEQDRYYRGQTQQIEAVLRSCPGFVQMQSIADAGHWVQFERPGPFHAALLGVLDRAAP